MLVTAAGYIAAMVDEVVKFNSEKRNIQKCEKSIPTNFTKTDQSEDFYKRTKASRFVKQGDPENRGFLERV